MEINILGYGLMGKQIAALFYLGGFDAVIWNHRPIDKNEVFKQINLAKKNFSNTKEGNIIFAESLEELKNNITIETVIEDIEIKKTIYKTVKNNISKPYFTNTSSLSPAEIAAEAGGIHFFNPVSILKVVELYLPNNAMREEISCIVDFLKSHDFDIIEVDKNRGYIGNYILFNEISSIFRLIEEHRYSADLIDKMYKHLYNGRSIFSIIDLIGTDVCLKILTNLQQENPFIYLPEILKEAVVKNVLGRKNRTSVRQIISENNKERTCI